MAKVSINEGRVPFQVPGVDEACFTYYKVFGDLSSGSPPLLTVHGGPGAGHEYLLPFADIWTLYGLPVIFYDQIGCAASTHLPQTAGDTSLWQEQLFVAELDNLVDFLNLREGPGFHMLGQSWGGSLAAAYASSRPKGLQRLVLASGLASKELSIRGRNLCRKALPTQIQEAIDQGERTGDRDSEAYREAIAIFHKTYLCRSDPFPPPELATAMRHTAEDKTVNGTMNGNNLWESTGTMRDWTCISRLPNIDVPTLVYKGEFDTSHDIATAPFLENIPQVRSKTLANGSHMPHLDSDEMRKRVLELVGDFLRPEAKTAPLAPKD